MYKLLLSGHGDDWTL